MSVLSKYVISPLTLAASLVLVGCNDSATSSAVNSVQDATSATSSCDPAISTCVTIGVFTHNGVDYVDQNRDLIYTVGANCETWSRTASGGDQHSAVEHLHYNAQTNSSYVAGIMTWYEYGPETSQAAIDTTCAAGLGGVQKSASLDTYTADKSFYVKIKSVQ